MTDIMNLLNTSVVFAVLLSIGCSQASDRISHGKTGETAMEKRLTNYRNTDFLSGGYEDTMSAAKPHFEQLIDGLIELGPDADGELKFKLFAVCVERVYELDEPIETVERDVFFEAWMRLAEIAGFCNTKQDAFEFEKRYLEVRDSHI